MSIHVVSCLTTNPFANKGSPTVVLLSSTGLIPIFSKFGAPYFAGCSTRDIIRFKILLADSMALLWKCLVPRPTCLVMSLSKDFLKCLALCRWNQGYTSILELSHFDLKFDSILLSNSSGLSHSISSVEISWVVSSVWRNGNDCFQIAGYVILDVTFT